MSVVRPIPPTDPIGYDCTAAISCGAISIQRLAAISGKLEQARRETLEDLDRWRAGGRRPEGVLDPAFIDLPDRLLADYGSTRPTSELFAILTTARRIRLAVDRVIMLGVGGASLGSRALFAACCHPFHSPLKGSRSTTTERRDCLTLSHRTQALWRSSRAVIYSIGGRLCLPAKVVVPWKWRLPPDSFCNRSWRASAETASDWLS